MDGCSLRIAQVSETPPRMGAIRTIENRENRAVTRDTPSNPENKVFHYSSWNKV